MKVLVLFHLPEGAGLLHCTLADLAAVPAARSTYIFRGSLYQVTRSIETLDRNTDGSRLTTTQQLVDLLAASAFLNKKKPSLDDLSRMYDVGDREPEQIIRLALQLVKDADRVIMFETELLGRVGAQDGKVLLNALTQAAGVASTGDSD